MKIEAPVNKSQIENASPTAVKREPDFNFSEILSTLLTPQPLKDFPRLREEAVIPPAEGPATENEGDVQIGHFVVESMVSISLTPPLKPMPEPQVMPVDLHIAGTMLQAHSNQLLPSSVDLAESLPVGEVINAIQSGQKYEPNAKHLMVNEPVNTISPIIDPLPYIIPPQQKPSALEISAAHRVTAVRQDKFATEMPVRQNEVQFNVTASSEVTAPVSDIPLETLATNIEVRKDPIALTTQAATANNKAFRTTAPQQSQVASPMPTPDAKQPLPAVVSTAERFNDALPLPVSVLSLPQGNTSLPPVADASLSALRAEVVAFSQHPSRPNVTIEVNPPEYGRVLVQARVSQEGVVTVRLIVENAIVKEHLVLHLQRSGHPAEIEVWTREEYRESNTSRDGRGERDQPERRYRPRAPRDSHHEFKV